MALGTVGYAVLIASSMVQTYGGHGPMDLSLVVVLLAVGGVAVLVASGLIAVREAMSALQQPPEPTHAG